jgi:RHH-type proline utilization regulon transcriptional repressor/proline dehydrogenase/delta 1-pyrroline-5-carboxylate dehydrogenase
VEDYITFEMLEGMANHLPRVMRKLEKQIILYTPVVKDEHFLNAVSYLVRRLDENTGKDNFLSYSFNLKFNSQQWMFLQEQFEEAFRLKDSIVAKPFRTQNRNTEQVTSLKHEKNVPPDKSLELSSFKNEPDTNFDLTPNRLWANSIRNKWKKSSDDKPYQIPVQIGDREVETSKKFRYIDRSQQSEICVCETSLSNLDQIKEIIDIAEKDKSKWRKTTMQERIQILHRTAYYLNRDRGNLIGCMSAITGKTFLEGDVEVSEATDFCRFYPLSMKAFDDLQTVQYTPKGVILVIPPWNFPLAIPTGGVAAALSGGNTVILKPATVALPVAWEFAKCFWDAGVPKDALQVVCTYGREPLNYLTSHSSIKHIILTGGTDTAFRLLENNPKCPLSAETGGKNSIILTASGDRDHAIQNIVTSAFSNAGQKCSACSLLLVEKSVYNDLDFRTKLIDSVKSMHTGGVWNGGNIVGPMITSQNDKLLYAVEHLEPGESWLVEPEFVDEKHYILKPCVKWGVKPDSYTFKTELFGPLLAVVCVENLDEGIELMNNHTEYGLTSGLQSLDEAEQLKWKNNIEAGNLYINRSITGAIVNRQPFGGMKRSAFGGGLKAGGRNYVSLFVLFTERPQNQPITQNSKLVASLAAFLNPNDKLRLTAAVESYLKNWADEFSLSKDTHHLIGEQNIFRYLPLKKMALRVELNDNMLDILMILVAAFIAKTPVTVSINPNDQKLETLRKVKELHFTILLQDENQFLSEIENYERIRTCNDSLSAEFFNQAAKTGKYVATAKPMVEGRLEMLHYLKEQSIAFEYHRYGSIAEAVD